MLDTLDAGAVRRWCCAAADALGRAREEIDALNVFPVPDGDTGTNLHLTMAAAARAAETSANGTGDAAATWRAVAQGALLGARGNSGVILSQVLRGLAEVLPTAVPCRGIALGAALRHATSLAYAAVAHPVEGTVLTVARAAGEAAVAAVDRLGADDLAAVASAAAAGARAALRRTRVQLDALARAGVVDAGGMGLCVVLDVLAAVVSGAEPAGAPAIERAVAPASGAPASGACTSDPSTDPRPVDQARADGPAYEVMYLLDAEPDGIPALREALGKLGDSLVVVGGERLWNVHVHVDDAGVAIEAGLAAGRPHRIRVTYLHGEHGRPPARGRGVVTIAAGEGLAALFEEAGATVLRQEPGRHPSLAEVLDALRRAGDEVVLLPNESGVHTVAEVAAARARDEGIRVSVIPTRAAVQCLAALAVHDPTRRVDDDVIAMTTAAGATRFGEVTVATGEAVTSAGICQAGDVLGLIEGDVVVIGSGIAEVTFAVVDRMLSGGGELVTLVTGKDVEAGLTDHVVAHLRATRPDVDTVTYDGGQGGCPVLIGVE